MKYESRKVASFVKKINIEHGPTIFVYLSSFATSIVFSSEFLWLWQRGKYGAI